LRLGDRTARDLGRLTLNPIPHIDPIGSVLVPLMSLATAGQVFIAWAKPVPINPSFFAHYRRDDILVSVIGPLSNVCLALCCSIAAILITKVSLLLQAPNSLFAEATNFLLKMFYGGISLNIMLAVFNMLPVPPLDGSHVVASILPANVSAAYSRIGFFGIFIIIILMRWQPFAHAFSSTIYVLTFPFFSLVRYFV
jgi:Zn-dependent protease